MKVVRYKADDAQPPATSSVFIPDNLLRTLEAVGVGCVADRAQQEISSPTVEDCPERRQVAVSSCHQLLKPLVVNLYLSMAVNSVLLFVFHLLAFFTPSVWSQEACSAEARVPVSVEGVSPAPECRLDYVVSLKHPRFNTHLCSGTLISSSWVLTLASCAAESRELPRAHINGYFRNGPFAEEISTTEVIIHESFVGGSSFDVHDVALYRLSRPSTQTPVSLSSSSVLAGSAVDVAGWGRVQSQGALSDTLQLGESIEVVSCSTDWPTVSDEFSCIAGNELGSCPGDAGGPVLITGSSAASDSQVGIVTDVMGNCGLSGNSGPFIEIAPLLSWITANS